MSDLLNVFGPPVVAFILCFFIWLTRGRDPNVPDAIFPLYKPPEGLSIIEAGVLVDDILQTKDIAYELYDLYFNEFIGFEENAYIKLLKDLNSKEVNSLPPTQKSILNILFAGNAKSIRLSSESNQFKAKEIKKNIYRRLVQKGYYKHTPDAERKIFYTIGYIHIVGGIGFNIATLFSEIKIQLPLSLILGLVFAGLVWGLFGTLMARKTVAGVKKYKELLGLKEFVITAEKDRIEYFLKNDPKAYKDILPYAFLFGVKEKWLAPAQNLNKSFFDENLLTITFKMDLDAFEQVFEEKQNILIALLNIIFFALIQATKFAILSLGSRRYAFRNFVDEIKQDPDMSEEEQAHLKDLKAAEKDKKTPEA